MPSSKKQLQQFLSDIDRALESGSFNNWERKFLTDMKVKLQRYGTRTTFSDKQYAKLMQLLRAAPSNVYVFPGRRPNNRKSKSGRLSYAVRREARWWSRRLLRDISIVAALLVVFAVYQFGRDGFNSFQSAPEQAYYSTKVIAQDISVIDGDTVRVTGEMRSIRLVGFNTPEESSPECSREAEVGRQATDRLSELLRTALLVEFEKVRCSCPPGTEGTSDCNYGRSCGRLRVDGRDVGDILISEDLAVPYICGYSSCPPRPGDWCSSN